MPLEPPSDDRQAVLANVKRLRQEYLKAAQEFELLHLAHERKWALEGLEGPHGYSQGAHAGFESVAGCGG